MMYTAQLPGHGPFVIRYPRGASVNADWQNPMEELEIGKGYCAKEGRHVAFLALGHSVNDALAAAVDLQRDNISAAVYDMRFLKPLDTGLLDTIAQQGYRRIITVEDGVQLGGFGESVMEYFAEHHPEQISLTRILAIPDSFITHGSVAQLKSDCHIDKQALISAAHES